MQDLNAGELKSLLQQTTKKIESADNNIEVNTIVEKLITSLIGSEYASLWIFDEDAASLIRERPEGSAREISMLNQRGIMVKSFLTITGGIYNYLASEKEYYPETDNPDEIRIKSKVIAPLLDGERFIGIVTAYSSIRQIKNFDEDDAEVLRSLSSFLIKVACYMHPELKHGQKDRIYIKEDLNNVSQQVIQKVEAIQEAKQVVEAPDATLNFLANTVHDIRTPANSMYGFLELLEEQIDNPRLLQYISNAKESAQFINDLTTSILDRVSSHHERSGSKSVCLNPSKFFADIAQLFSANMYNKQLDFNVFVDPALPKEISVDSIKLKRIVMNLIGNAYKFTPKGERVEFSVVYKREKKMMQVSLKDTGIGIAKEKQKEIFKAFKQAEDTTNVEFGGTGLGLSICAEYVKDMGGALKLESALDVGSTFYFEIPLEVTDKTENLPSLRQSSKSFVILLESRHISVAQNITEYLLRMGVSEKNITISNTLGAIDKKSTHFICFQNKMDVTISTFVERNNMKLLVVEEVLLSLAKDEERLPYKVISKYDYYGDTLYDFMRDGSRTKVLVVDDDRINIELVKAFLEDDFYHVDIAQDGLRALELLKQALDEGEPFELVYLDQNMPGHSGKEVLTQYRAYEKEKKGSTIYAVSISVDPLEQGTKAGLFDAHVGKPFKKREIKEILQRLKGK